MHLRLTSPVPLTFYKVSRSVDRLSKQSHRSHNELTPSPVLTWFADYRFHVAEPLSFVASIAALVTLAGTVASKGYRYLKAAKDGRNDAWKLMAEVDVLCGILGRLIVLLQSRKPQSNTQKNAVSRDGRDKEKDV